MRFADILTVAAMSAGGGPYALNGGNLVTQPDTFDNAYWTKDEMTVVADQAVAPNGATAMDLAKPSANSTAHIVRSAVFAISGPVTISFYAKASGYSKVAFRESEATGAYASFDLAGSVLDSGDAGGWTVTNESVTLIGDGVYRCSLLLTPSAPANTNIGLYVLPDAYVSGQPNDLGWVGDTVKGVLLWRAQAYP